MANAGDAGRPKPRTRAPKAAPEPARPENDLDLGAGTWRAAIADEELRRSYPDTDFDDRGWEPVTIPSQWRSTPAFADSDGPVLYRTAFATPDPFGPGAERADEADEPRRSWLLLDGLFYTSDVWLDGSYLGDTEGYFFPHAFEVTDALAAHTEHTLALEVSCRRESDRTAKRNLTGTFQHGDLVPRDSNPGGIWRPVRLEQSGAVRITHFRALCRDASAEQATVFVRAVLDTIEARTVELVTTIVPCNQGPEVAFAEGFEHRQTQPLAQGENRVEWTVTVPEPRRWWPHALGEQPLYEVIVEVCAPADRGELVSDRKTVRMGLRSVSVDDWIFSINGERLFLKGANYGPTTVALADASDADLARDVALAKEANLDFLRVHAHVARPELYDAADDAGLLLWQDMPLQWGYHRSIRKQARRQSRELVDLLAHHPSVFVWCGHNEPLAIDPDAETDSNATGRALVGQLLPTWNKSVLDHSIKKVIEKADGSRPVIPHSGVLPHLPQLDGTDSHLFWDGRDGDVRTFEALVRVWPRLARFVSELGAPAAPAAAPSLAPDPSQRAQADLLKHHIETLRRIKYRPCGGFAQFHFADAFPGTSCSVLDHERVPKLGYQALRDACRPVIVVADRLPAEVVPGATFSLDLHVVNDTRIAHDDMMTHVHLFSASAGVGEEGHEPTRPWQTWSWHGQISPDSCSRIGTLELVVPDALGDLVVRLELRGPDGLVADNRYESLVVRA
jgi:beta-mannosidase